MHRRYRRALGWALAIASLSAASPAQAQVGTPGKPSFDSREGRPDRPAGPTNPAALQARDRLSGQLGRQGVLDMDERTGTPRLIGRLDGFLTGPSGDDPAHVALGYVRAHEDVFGLSADDLAALRLARRYTDDSGITHLIWAQTWRGIEAWDNDLRASVTADGRLINVGGSPVPGLATRTAAPELNASQALGRALGDAGRRGLAPRATGHGGPDQETTFAGGHDAKLVLFTERAGDVHLAWDVTDRAQATEVYEHVIDARSGELLYRENQVHAVDASVKAFEYHPGAGADDLRTVPVTDGSKLAGPNAHVFTNVDGDSVIAPSEEVAADDPLAAVPVWSDAFSDKCGTGLCSWVPGSANSWEDDRPHTAQQVYYFLNTFHDWLETEVGFTNGTGGFGPGDVISADALQGAGKNAGLPTSDVLDNAFMVPSPDGQGAGMAMFLFRSGRSGGDDAGVVYHEYTHGLSSRLIVAPGGSAALRTKQSGAMGEGWSDWFALDYLVDRGLETDTAAAGEVALGEYAEDNATGVRFDSIDCPMTSTDAHCTRSRDTYGDFARGGNDEVHADGEIWAQTLWDLRQALGGNGAGAGKARRMIAQAMRLSPGDPSFLDMRNAILQADQSLNAGVNRDTIWQVFAARGMGLLAFSDGGNDETPEQDFTPPAALGTGAALTGRVTDANTGAPVAGALIDLGNLPGELRGLTDSNGDYSIAGLPPATFAHARISAPGYELIRRPITVGAAGSRVDQTMRRNFAATSGGATVRSFTGPDNSSFGCGPQHLLDGDEETVWGSESGGAKQITIALPQAADVGAFRVDPGAGCGDDDTASVGSFRVETSPDGTTFTTASAGAFTPADNHRLNEIPANASGVRFVRFTMVAPQSSATGTSGEDFLDAAELEVLPPRPTEPARPDPGAGPAPGGGAGPAPDLTAPIGALELVARQKLRTALSKGLKVTVECNEPCSAKLTATLDAKTAKKLKLLSRRSRAKTVKVASGSLRTGPGRRTATLRFTSRGKKLLKKQKRLKLGVTATLADASGNKASRKLAISLKR